MSDSQIPTRRALLGAAAAALVVVPLQALAQDGQAPKAAPARPAPLDPELVKSFVIAGHVDLDKVKSLLAEHPTLLNATIDWGGGDFESAIGGAGHMGRADIARYLIEHGARYDIFVAAMLGELDIVKAAIAKTPTLAQSKGPHGIPLMVHATKGGDAAKAVVEYLASLAN